MYYRVEARATPNSDWEGLYRPALRNTFSPDDEKMLTNISGKYKTTGVLGYLKTPNAKCEHWFTQTGWGLVSKVMQHLVATYPDNVRIRQCDTLTPVFSHYQQVVIEYGE